MKFLQYFRDNWIPKYKENIINYSKINEKEQTNNSLENYHKHLQSKLTKYDSLFAFIIFVEIQL